MRPSRAEMTAEIRYGVTAGIRLGVTAGRGGAAECRAGKGEQQAGLGGTIIESVPQREMWHRRRKELIEGRFTLPMGGAVQDETVTSPRSAIGLLGGGRSGGQCQRARKGASQRW